MSLSIAERQAQIRAKLAKKESKDSKDSKESKDSKDSKRKESREEIPSKPIFRQPEPRKIVSKPRAFEKEPEVEQPRKYVSMFSKSPAIPEDENVNLYDQNFLSLKKSISNIEFVRVDTVDTTTSSITEDDKSVSTPRKKFYKPVSLHSIETPKEISLRLTSEFTQLEVSFRYTIGIKWKRHLENHETFIRRLYMYRTKVTFSIKDFDESLRESDVNVNAVESLDSIALRNLGFSSQDSLNPQQKRKFTEELKRVEDEIRTQEFRQKALLGCKLSKDPLSNEDVSSLENIELRKKVIVFAKKLASDASKNGPSKKELIKEKMLENKEKQTIESDEAIFATLSKISSRDISTLQKIGSYTSKLSSPDLIQQALICLWKNLSTDNELLRKNIYIEITDRQPLPEIVQSKKKPLTYQEMIIKSIKDFGAIHFPNAESRIIFALENRADIMEPFSPLYKLPFKWDPFQIEALKHIKNGTSVVVSAPTSSGKTLLSQYATSMGKYTIFVGPTPELVSQQAAEIRNRSSPGFDFTPIIYLEGETVRSDDGAKIIIGTPSCVMNYFGFQNTEMLCFNNDAVEEKLLEFDSLGETNANSNIPSVLNYEILVIDEIQQVNLDDEEARCMLNLIKLFAHATQVVLSATISNIDQVTDWIRQVKSGYKNNRVESVVYRKRFINQEKMVYSNKEMQVVSPLSVLTVDLIRSGVLNATEMQFPSQQLPILSRVINTRETNIVNFFQNKPVTLYTCKEYEDLLKRELTKISIENPEKMQEILNAFSVPDVTIESLDISDLYKILKNLQKKNMLKAIIFMFDPVKCRDTCAKLWQYMDSEEKRRFPLLRTLKELNNEYCSKLSEQLESISSKVVKDKGSDSTTADSLFERKDSVETGIIKAYKDSVTSLIDRHIVSWNQSIVSCKEELVDKEILLRFCKAIEKEDDLFSMLDSKIVEIIKKNRFAFLENRSEENISLAIENLLKASTNSTERSICEIEIEFLNLFKDSNFQFENPRHDLILKNFLKEINKLVNGENDAFLQYKKFVEKLEQEYVFLEKSIDTFEELIENYTREKNSILYKETISMMNIYAPHPDYTFSNIPITVQVMRDIRNLFFDAHDFKSYDLAYLKSPPYEKKEFIPRPDYKDQFMLWCERGFTIYTKNIKEISPRFQGVAQILMEEFGVQILFSDASYAYGVNLPVRTVVFYNPDYNTKGFEKLPVILAHQAQGRGARRGWDTRGYVCYVGVEHKRLMLGKYLNIEGCDSLDNIIGSQILFNENFPVNRLTKICLNQFCKIKEESTSKAHFTQLLLQEESNNKNKLITNIRNFGVNNATQAMQSYRLAQHTPYFDILQTFACFLTDFERTQVVNIDEFEFVKAITHIVYPDRFDENTDSSLNFEKIMSAFDERMRENGYVYNLGVVNNLASYVRANNIIDVTDTVINQLKFLMNVIGTLYDNNDATVARWKTSARNSLVTISTLIYKNTI